MIPVLDAIRSTFNVWRLAFGGAVTTPVTLIGQDIGNIWQLFSS
jgi:hypothetical protein